MAPPDTLKDRPDTSRISLETILANDSLKGKLLESIFHLDGYHELSILASFLEVRNIDPATRTFEVGIKGVKDTPLKVQFDGRNFLIDAQSEEKFVQNPLFSKKYYIEALRFNKQISAYFDRAAEVFDKMTEDYLFHFFGRYTNRLSDATLSHPFRGFDLKLFEGSVPNADLLSVLLGKKFALLYQLASGLEGAKTLREVEKIRHENFDVALIALDQLTNIVSARNIQKQREGKDWTRDEFQFEVLRPLLAIGTKSIEYTNILEDFHGEIFNRLITTNHISKSNFYLGIDIFSSFVYYTARIDSVDLDKIDYNNLSDPKNVESLKKLNYFDYVRQTLLENFPNKNPNVMSFEQWSKSQKVSAAPLNFIDSHPPLKHDAASRSAPDQLTEMEGEFEKLFDKAMTLIFSYEGIKRSEVRAFYATLFKINPTSGKSHISAECEAINNTKPNMKRSEQLALIQKAVNKYVDYILNEDRFWLSISMKDRAKILWHKLTH